MECAQCGGKLQVGPNGPVLVCKICENELVIPEAIRTNDDLLVLNQPAQHRCPVCKLPMQTAILDSIAVEHCAPCQGTLVDDRHFAQVIRAGRASYDGEVVIPKPLDQTELQKRSSCPGCEQLMDVHAYHGPSNVVIDSCFSCGLVWLDSLELTRIIQAPGLRSRC